MTNYIPKQADYGVKIAGFVSIQKNYLISNQ
jgi:hypothetical protein